MEGDDGGGVMAKNMSHQRGVCPLEHVNNSESGEDIVSGRTRPLHGLDQQPTSSLLVFN